jgi:hypothetical protein
MSERRVQLQQFPFGYRVALEPKVQSCGNCWFFLREVGGPEGPHWGKCFVAHANRGRIFGVSGKAVCNYYEREGGPG